MKPLFKNITIYNQKNFNDFVKFHGEKFSLSYNIYTYVLLFLILYCMILNIIQKNLLLFVLFLVIFGLTILFRIYLPTIRFQKNKKKFSNHKEKNITIDFYKYYFKIENNIWPYIKLYKVFETKEYFYLYIDEDNAILVSKNGFVSGTVEDFTEFIKKKCLLKYNKQSNNK